MPGKGAHISSLSVLFSAKHNNANKKPALVLMPRSVSFRRSLKYLWQQGDRHFLGLWRINWICTMAYFKAWLTIVARRVLGRHCSLLQSEVHMELTQLGLTVNDSCCGPAGTHLSRMKVFRHAPSWPRVRLCNELCPATLLRREERDLLLALNTPLTRYYWRVKYNYTNVSVPSILERQGFSEGCADGGN